MLFTISFAQSHYYMRFLGWNLGTWTFTWKKYTGENEINQNLWIKCLLKKFCLCRCIHYTNSLWTAVLIKSQHCQLLKWPIKKTILSCFIYCFSYHSKMLLAVVRLAQLVFVSFLNPLSPGSNLGFSLLSSIQSYNLIN